MLIYNDIVSMAETRFRTNYNLEPSREGLESQGFKLSRTETNTWNINLVVEGKEVMHL